MFFVKYLRLLRICALQIIILIIFKPKAVKLRLADAILFNRQCFSPLDFVVHNRKNNHPESWITATHARYPSVTIISHFSLINHNHNLFFMVNHTQACCLQTVNHNDTTCFQWLTLSSLKTATVVERIFPFIPENH